MKSLCSGIPSRAQPPEPGQKSERDLLIIDILAARSVKQCDEVAPRVAAWMKEHPKDLNMMGTAEQLLMMRHVDIPGTRYEWGEGDLERA